ncbi:DNA-binding protein [Bacteroidia bacterium]|nr:DNA-binding protein [Bacteroidia bacterium]
MYLNNDDFERWMEKLSKKLDAIGKDLKTIVNTNEVFGEDEKLLDNQDLCLTLHISKRTLQRYRSEYGLPYLKHGQKIYYKTSDVREFIFKNGDYWDKKAIMERLKAKDGE